MSTPDEETLVRGSAQHKDYMKHQFGWLTGMVNGLEDGLAISGRSLLLIFILYTTVKAGLMVSHHNVPWWLDTIMLAFQVCGLEGAIPGLSRLRETLLAKNTPAAHEDAQTVSKAIKSARVLNMLTGVEVFLSAYANVSWQIAGHTISMADISQFYSYILLLFRLWQITSFISAMARMETKRPKVISQAEQKQSDVADVQAELQAKLTDQANQFHQALATQKQEIENTLREQIADVSQRFENTLGAQRLENRQLLAMLEEAKNTPSEVFVQTVFERIKTVFLQSVVVQEETKTPPALPPAGLKKQSIKTPVEDTQKQEQEQALEASRKPRKKLSDEEVDAIVWPLKNSDTSLSHRRIAPLTEYSETVVYASLKRWQAFQNQEEKNTAQSDA